MTSPSFADGNCIGGNDDLRRYLRKTAKVPDAVTYTSVTVTLAVAALMALAGSWASATAGVVGQSWPFGVPTRQITLASSPSTALHIYTRRLRLLRLATCYWRQIMKTVSRKSLVSMLGSLALVLALGGSAWAQDTMPAGSGQGMDKMGTMHPDMKGMHKNMHKNMMGMHMMPATVTETDAKTGIVDVMSGGMALKVHFPPKAMAALREGDKITLHMGFSKP